MGILVACLSTGKGTWGHVSRLIEESSYDKVILITNDYGKENFNKNDKTELIALNLEQGLRELRDEIYANLKDKINDAEVGVNLFCFWCWKRAYGFNSSFTEIGNRYKISCFNKGRCKGTIIIFISSAFFV